MQTLVSPKNDRYYVILYFFFGTVIATVDEQPNGEILYFDTLKEAEEYGRTKTVPFEAVKIKENIK